MLSCTPKRVTHLPNTTLPTKSCTEHRDYIDVALELQPRRTTQLQGNELRPRAIHYAHETCPVISPTALPALPAIL